ncbi:MAG: hypothetical protein HRT73_01185 [Flavobacteriales bacterium]|nr:hypothetical protein [Flavobacteriales bacterium]
MKPIGLLIFILLILGYSLICQLPWHLARNTHNVLPKGNLTLIVENTYQDENGLIWELQPHSMNIFHQPKNPIVAINTPYPNLDKPLQLDIENPNLKLLSKDKNRGSYEAILQPNGSYLTTGTKQGTYNYRNPEGFIGMTKHVLMDVIPHFINANYKQTVKLNN